MQKHKTCSFPNLSMAIIPVTTFFDLFHCTIYSVFCVCLLRVQNRVLLERLSHMEAQLKASEEDTDRLRMERERLRDRLSELQTTLREKEAEVTI